LFCFFLFFFFLFFFVVVVVFFFFFFLVWFDSFYLTRSYRSILIVYLILIRFPRSCLTDIGKRFVQLS
jgi:hypothetical protein